MSLFPCSIHGARVKGSLGSVYVSALDGTNRYSRRMRVCSPCLADFLATVGSEWVPADPGGSDQPIPMCSSCSKPATSSGTAWAVFCTVYEPGADRIDYFGAVHAKCASEFVSGLNLESV